MDSESLSSHFRRARPMMTTALLAAALVAGIAPVEAVPIAELHQNDANGVPVAPHTIGSPVSVTGVVTVADSVFNRFSTAVHVQDETGGIYIFQSGGVFLWNFDDGDSVTVEGQIAHFNGWTEITALTNVFLHAVDRPGPEPLELTCADVNATFDSGTFREDNESLLIKIRDVSITGGSWPTTAGGNVELTISDGTGSTTMLIYSDTDLNGSPAPPSVFDVTGVIQQSDATSPHTSGYRIAPRGQSDLGGDGPLIISGPTVEVLSETSALVEWTTSVPASSTVEYGPTTAYGQSFDDPTLVTNHSVMLDPIDDASWYNARVVSSDSEGTTFSPNFTFRTEPATDEAIMVFFNKSIDPAYAAGKVAAGDVPFPQILIDYLDQAEFTIDAAFYSLSLPEVADALIDAHNRGVEVRVIKESSNSLFQYNRLVAAGIPAITSDFAGPHSGIHHNKFWVIDARDATSTLDDWVVTGSWNPTFQGTDSDAQNLVVIKDTGVATAYTDEFDEMWGSSTTIPDAGTSRFGDDKFNNTESQHVVNGIDVEVYFAPSDNHENIMLVWFNDTDTSIYFSILAFTRDQLSQGMKNRFDAIEGFEVRGVFDDDFDQFSEYPKMNGTGGAGSWSPPADVHLGNYAPGFLHHKYVLLDSGNPASNPMAITGSANFSTAARSDNDENQLHIHDYDLTRVFLQEFAERYHAAGGTGELGGGTTAIGDPGPAPGTPLGLRLTNVPNPFNPRTTIHFALEDPASAPSLVIFDAQGRAVRELELGAFMNAGEYSIDWDGTNAEGAPVASGVYYARLEAAGTVETRSMVLAR